MMQLGIFAKTFAGTTPEFILRAAARTGYATVQYNMSCSGLPSLPEQISQASIDEIRAAVHAAGVSICALSATYNMVHPDIAVRNQGARSLEMLASTARALRVPLLTLCTGSRNTKDQWAYHPENQSRDAWRDLQYSMGQALEIAEANNIDLGIEPEYGNVINSAGAAKLLITQMGSTRLKVVFDPANLVTTENVAQHQQIIASAIDELAAHIVLAHAKDRDQKGNVVAAGQGVLDFPHMISRLRSIGYDGPMVTHGLLPAEAPHVNEFLQGLIK